MDLTASARCRSSLSTGMITDTAGQTRFRATCVLGEGFMTSPRYCTNARNAAEGKTSHPPERRAVMAHDEESDPQERYFRPRPGAPGDEDAAEVDGVAFGDAESARVRVARTGRRTDVAPDGARRQRRFLMTTGVMSTAVLLFSGGGWAFQDYVLGSVRRVNAFEGLKNRPDSG